MAFARKLARGPSPPVPSLELTLYLSNGHPSISPPLAGRLAPAPAEEDAQSEASEWEIWERTEREEERRAEEEEMGAEVEKPLFLPTPVSMASVGEK
jgi:hypothetical protein